MKKQIILLGVLVAVAASSELLWEYGHKKSPTMEPVYSYQQNTTLIDLTDATDFATTAGSYPQFKNADAAFNTSIKDFVQAAIKDQFENSAENYKARVDTSTPDENVPPIPKPADRFPLTVATKIIRNDTHIISAIVRIDQYTGGAHGQESIGTFNYDLDTKNPITIQSLVQKDPELLQKLSKLSRTTLRTQLATAAQVAPADIDTAMLNDGTSPIPENFSLFTFPDENHITLYFNQYQIGPYVYGTPEITLPFPLQ